MTNWDARSEDYLLSLGFSKYKKTKYVMLNQDIFYYLSFEGIKNNIDVWYVFHPLVLPELSPNKGWSGGAGGIPSKPLSIENDSDIPGVQLLLKECLQNSLPKLLAKASSLEGLSEMYNLNQFPKGNYPKLVCYLAAKRYDKAKEVLQWLMSNFDQHPQGDDVKSVINYLSTLETPREIEQWLEQQKELNLKHLSLVRLYKQVKSLS